MKSENATIRIPELDLEIPPETQKGTINTVEGLFSKTVDGLQELQEERRVSETSLISISCRKSIQLQQIR